MIYYVLSALLGMILGGFITFLIMKLSFQKQANEINILKSQIKIQEDFRNIIKEDFSKLASETINEQQSDLRKQNREILDEKIKPLNETLENFKKQVVEFQQNNAERKAEIMTELKHLKENNKQLSDDAIKLTNALTMSQNVKGSYGEGLLESILQKSGLTEGIHYLKQQKTTSANTKDEQIHNIKPDFIIKLPNNKHLIIDSKLTLTSYLEYQKDKTKESKTIFIRAIKERIKDLSNKNYENAKDFAQPDFILLYMPVESCAGMVYSDEDFDEVLNLAYNSNIIIVGSASLLTTIRLVNQLWAIQSQCENSNRITKAGVTLYETFVAFCDSLIEIQKKFNAVSSEFTTAINRFNHDSPKHPSLFSQLQILKDEYKLNTSAKIPDEFLSSQEVTEENSEN